MLASDNSLYAELPLLLFSLVPNNQKTFEQVIKGLSDAKKGKLTWENGPWQREPDRLAWKYRGYNCLLLRNPELWTLCGYVQVPVGHPYCHRRGGKNKRLSDLLPIRVHGGLTYTGGYPDFDGTKSKKNELWIGFDCGHADDLMPLSSVMHALLNKHGPKKWMPGSTYKDVAFVQKQVNGLVNQLISIARSAKKCSR